MFGNPFQKHLQEAGLVFEISLDQTSIAFVKQNSYAVLEYFDGIWAYWIGGKDGYLMLNDVKFVYRQFHSIEGNTELKKYLTHLFGYEQKEKEDESDNS